MLRGGAEMQHGQQVLQLAEGEIRGEEGARLAGRCGRGGSRNGPGKRVAEPEDRGVAGLAEAQGADYQQVEARLMINIIIVHTAV